MKKSASLLLTVAIAVIASWGTTYFTNRGTSPATSQSAKESAYDRVMRTRTLRCGYVLYAPAVMKSLNTGAFSGIIHDITELMGKRLGLKVHWAEEVSFGSMIEGLKAGRYDALCINGWPSGYYANQLGQTITLYYSVIDPYVRANDGRFDFNLDAINDPSITIATIDGNSTKVIADQNYPKAKQLSMPQTTDFATALMNVANFKADIAFIERHQASAFMEKNPNKIRRVNLNKPMRYYANGLQMDIGDYKLMAMFNMAIEEMHGSGDIDEILARYRDDPPSSLSIDKPYME